MLKNYFITALRNVRRQQLTTLINTAGLAMGITCALVIYLMISFATSYNTDFANSDRLFRLVTDVTNQNGDGGTGGVPPPLPEAVMLEISGIELQTFISAASSETLVRTGQDVEDFKYFQFNEHVAYTEPAYFDIFSITIKSGSFDQFNEPSKVVINETMAETLFPGEDAVGRILQVNGKDGFQVIAVANDLPDNTDIPFKFLISYETIRKEYLEQTGWGSVSSDDQLYMVLSDNVRSEDVEKQFPAFIDKHFEENNSTITYRLQPAREWHQDDRYTNYSQRTFSNTNVISLSLVAVFLIITACVNFINLKTALALQRIREIGIRKVLGSGKKELIFQFMGETFLIVLTATLLSLGIAELLLIQLNALLESDLHITFSLGFMVFLLGLILTITLLAGLYPALVIAKYNPALAIKNVVNTSGRKGMKFRKSLVTFQFFISQFFIIGTIVLISQMNYIASLDLGFATESILNIPVPDSENQKKKSLKAEILQIPQVELASLMYSTPVSGSISITDYNIGSEDELLTAIKVADQDYLTMYDIPMLAGIGLDDSDTINSLVVNEKWVTQSGFDSPDEALGTMVSIWGYDVPVVGVVKNFHTVSARGDIQAVTIMSGLGNVRQLGVKVRTSNLSSTVENIEDVWKKFYPEYTFEYEFLDSYIADFYESERRMTQIFSFFSLVAIGIGMLGLFGLIAFTTERRIKEVSVRKVMGASVKQIFMMFSWDVLKLVFIAFLFSAPLAWYVMNKWLENYTFQVDMDILTFLIALLATIIISLATISYRSWQTAYTNPADSFRAD
jgi:putative ABC transport system permease protein